MKKIITILVSISCVLHAEAQMGGYSLNFDGVNDYIMLPNNSNFQPTGGAFTAEAWININAAGSSDQKVLMNLTWSGGAKGYAMNIYNSAGQFTFCSSIYLSGTAYWSPSSAALTPGEWYHVAMTWQQGGYITSYLNGEKIGETATGSSIYTSSSLSSYVGCGSGGSWAYFKGEIDEVRIWNSCKTESEIKAGMYKDITTHSNLRAYYKMSNGSGSSLSDNSGNNNNASIYNGAIWKASACFAGPRNALVFNGTNQYVTCGNQSNTNISGTQICVEAWIQPTDFKTNYWDNTIVASDGGTYYGYALSCGGTGLLSFSIGNGAGGSRYTVVSDSGALELNEWSHVAATYNGSNICLYVNGRNVKSEAISTSIADGGYDFTIGESPGNTGRCFAGKIDEIRIWNIMRSKDEICSYMMQSLTGSESGLSAYYRYDESDGSVLYESCANAHGTLVNSPSRISSGAYNTWIGSESSAWNNARNWSRGVPISGENVGLQKWSSLANTCIISQSPTLNNLIIKSGSNVSFASNFSVNRNLHLYESVNLNSSNISLGCQGHLLECNAYFYGENGSISTSRVLNHVSQVDIAGLGIELSSDANLGFTTISRGHAEQSNGITSILRYYDISPTNNTDLDASITFHYYDNEINTKRKYKLVQM